MILARLVYLFAECGDFTIQKRNKTQRTTKKTLNATSENEIVSTSKKSTYDECGNYCEQTRQQMKDLENGADRHS